MRKLLLTLTAASLLLLPQINAQDVMIGGEVDVGFTHNFNDPGKADDPTDNRFTNANDDTFQVSLAQIHLWKDAEPVGFSAKLDFFETAKNPEGIDGVGADGDDDIAIQEAYINWNAEFGNGVNVKAGKLGTLLGRDDIESSTNWFMTYSRNFLLVPRSHTGVRASYAPVENVNLSVGVNNGGDIDIDDNHGKTVEAAADFSPSEAWAFTAAINYGTINADNEGDKRLTLTLVSTMDVTDEISVYGEFLYRTDEGGRANADGSISDRDYWGINVGGIWRYTDGASAALRFQYNDEDTAGPGGDDDLQIWSASLTTSMNLTEDLELRIETRYDDASGATFVQEGAFGETQTTVGAQLIYTF